MRSRFPGLRCLRDTGRNKPNSEYPSFNSPSASARNQARSVPSLLCVGADGLLFTMTYREKLKDPRWKVKRMQAIERAHHTCEECGNYDTPYFHVHHKRYLPDYEPWDYDLDDLKCVCPPCHSDIHAARRVLDAVLVDASPDSLREIAKLISITGHDETRIYELSKTYMLKAGVAACERLGIDLSSIGQPLPYSRNFHAR
jgi:hypothetical protein